MASLEDLKKYARTKSRECKVQSSAYSYTLMSLKPANFVLVVFGGLLSLAAGASILVENNIITEMHAGIMALISSAFTFIHASLKCDHYQAECKKLEGFYEGMADNYSNLCIKSEAGGLEAQLNSLNSEVSSAKKHSSSPPFGWAKNLANERSE